MRLREFGQRLWAWWSPPISTQLGMPWFIEVTVGHLYLLITLKPSKRATLKVATCHTLGSILSNPSPESAHNVFGASTHLNRRFILYIRYHWAHTQDLSKPLLLSTSNCKKGQTTTTTEHHPRPARRVGGCQGLRKLPARRRRRSRYYIKPFFTALQLQSQCLQGNRLYNFTLATTREMTDEMLMHEVIVQRPTDDRSRPRWPLAAGPTDGLLRRGVVVI